MIVTIAGDQYQWGHILHCAMGLRTDVFISKLVRESHSLRLMLHRLSIHNGIPELLHDGAMDSIALGDVPVSMDSPMP